MAVGDSLLRSMISSPGKPSWFPIPGMISLVLIGPLIQLDSLWWPPTPASEGHSLHHYSYLARLVTAGLHRYCSWTGLFFPSLAKYFPSSRDSFLLEASFHTQDYPIRGTKPRVKMVRRRGTSFFYHLVTLGKFHSFSASKLLVPRYLTGLFSTT